MTASATAQTLGCARRSRHAPKPIPAAMPKPPPCRGCAGSRPRAMLSRAFARRGRGLVPGRSLGVQRTGAFRGCMATTFTSDRQFAGS